MQARYIHPEATVESRLCRRPAREDLPGTLVDQEDRLHHETMATEMAMDEVEVEGTGVDMAAEEEAVEVVLALRHRLETGEEEKDRLVVDTLQTEVGMVVVVVVVVDMEAEADDLTRKKSRPDLWTPLKSLIHP